ncbi:hypothetical protein [Moorena producens]|nr:hypothetical protein [Moorena producens]
MGRPRGRGKGKQRRSDAASEQGVSPGDKTLDSGAFMVGRLCRKGGKLID